MTLKPRMQETTSVKGVDSIVSIFDYLGNNSPF